MGNTGGKSAKKQNPNLQNFDLSSSGSGIEYPSKTGWLWQSDTNRSNSNSRDVSLVKETGPELSLPGLTRELSNGQTQGSDSAFPPETTESISMLTSLSTCYWHWCLLWGKVYEGVIPKEGALPTIHSCTAPLSHENSRGTMLFKFLFYCSWLIMFICSLGWQRKLSSICTSAWKFLLWGMTVIHLPGHVVPKNSLILVFSLSKISVSLSTFWTLITKFPSQILTTTLSVSSSLQKLLLIKLFLAKPAAHLKLSNEWLLSQVPEGQSVSIIYPTPLLGFLWWTAQPQTVTDTEWSQLVGEPDEDM